MAFYVIFISILIFPSVDIPSLFVALMKHGVRMNQSRAVTAQTCIEVTLRTNWRPAFALRFFKLIQLLLIAESHFLTKPFTFFATSLAFQTNSPVTLAILHFFHLPYI